MIEKALDAISKIFLYVFRHRVLHDHEMLCVQSILRRCDPKTGRALESQLANVYHLERSPSRKRLVFYFNDRTLNSELCSKRTKSEARKIAGFVHLMRG